VIGRRFGRACIYMYEDGFQPLFDPGHHRTRDCPVGSTFSPNTNASMETLPIPDTSQRGKEPVYNESPSQLTVDTMVSAEALKYLGDFDMMREISESYFNSVHHRMPIVSRKRFYGRLPNMNEASPADFTALCLSMYLIQQPPALYAENMRSSFYFAVKSIISLLEAANCQSVEAVQCRLLLTFYEIGHGIHPAASISIGACAKLARALGLHKMNLEAAEGDSARIIAGEKKRVWWTMLSLER
jgi:hypothetical protein